MTAWFMPTAGLAALLGMAVQLQSPRLPSWPLMLASAATGALLLLLGAVLMLRATRSSSGAIQRLATPQRPGEPQRHLAWAALASTALAAALLGHAQTGLRAHERLAQRLAATLEGEELQLIGVIAELPRLRADHVRLRVAVEQAWRVGDGRRVSVPPLVSLGWYDLRAGDPQARSVAVGERWQLPVRLWAQHGLVNPQGFDVELWLFEQGVGATGSVRSTVAARQRPPERLGEAGGYPVQRLRQTLREAIFARLGDSRAAGVVAALCIGDQAAISREDWDLFRRTGIAHLVAISGVHLTMLAWLAAAVVSRLWRRWPAALLVLPAPIAARVAGVLVAMAYAMLAGWGVPAQRTVFMIAVAALAPLSGRRWPWPMVLGAAALVVCLLDPWALLQPGFWLSFVAVGLLLLQGEPAPSATVPDLGRGVDRAAPAAMSNAEDTEPRDETARPSTQAAGEAPSPPPDQGEGSTAGSSPEPWWHWLHRRLLAPVLRAAHGGVRAQLVATIGLAPLSLLFFHQLAVLGLLANLVAIPLVTLLITPLVLAGCALAPLWSLAALLVDGLGAGLALLAGLPMAQWQPPTAPVWAQVAALAGAVLLLLPAPRSLRLGGLALALPLFWPVVAVPDEGQFELLAADVGQGQAVLVRTRQHSLLYDAGPQYSRESDAGERVLVPLLRSLGVAPLDLLMLSHRDTDHVGGARAVLEGIGARALQSSLEDGHALRLLATGQGRAHEPCLAGQRWNWDGVRFEVLHPTPADYARHAAGQLKPNGLSCVLRIAAGERSALLVGDIEQPQELALLARDAPGLRSEVLLVPHHGSRSSSDPAFLQAVAPRQGIVQAGHHNRYGHPAPEVMARFDALGIEVVRTNQCGAWHWRSADASSWCQRLREPRHWRAPFRGDGLELAKSSSENSPP